MLSVMILLALACFIGWVLYQILDRRSLRFNMKSSLEQTFLDVIPLLDAHNIEWFLDYGTLLGYYRDGGIMEHEFDVDLAIHAKYADQLIEALKILPNGYYLKKPKSGNFTSWNRISIKIRHKNRRGNLDIFLYYPFKNQSLCQGKACILEQGQLIECVTVQNFSQVPEAWFFPLKKGGMKVKGQWIECGIPNQTPRYIQHLFGDNLEPDMVGFLGNSCFIRPFWRRKT